MTATLTAEDRATLRTAAFGAIVLVSNADPGFFAMLRESYAASGALVASSGVVNEIVTTGDVPSLPDGSVEQLQAVVLPALTRSVEILRTAAPQEVDVFRTVVADAVERVARAVSGVSTGEAEMVRRVQAALDVT